MSYRITLTISDDLADLIECQRGIRSVQDFIVTAAIHACTGSPVETELRRQLSAMHETVRLLGGARPVQAESPIALPTNPSAPTVEKIGW